MKTSFWTKITSLLLAIVLAAMAMPLNVFAEAVQSGEESTVYLKELRIAQAETKEEAMVALEGDGFTFLDNNLNEGTDEEGIWLGYKTTTDPTEAIYDMKLMNMNGGFTLTSMDEAIKAQESIFAEMAVDLEMLIDEFVEAYEENLIPAQKAYKALNFFRLVEKETEVFEANGLGYQIVNGGMTTGMITEMIMFCDPAVVDSIVKILTMGIQLKNENWMEKLSELGPYDEDVPYGEDEDGKVRLSEDELKRRAKQLEMVIDFYGEAYNAFDELGLVSGKLDENFEIQDAQYKTPDELTADELAAKKADESRYKFYKLVYDELETYSYGTGETLKDFFRDSPGTKDLYPLVSILSDGEFAAISYGCFLEVAVGASAKIEDFDCYDAVYEDATKDIKSIYLYNGVDKALLTDDAIVGFTDTATRHMAATGELEFFENKTLGELAWEKGVVAAKIIGISGLAVMGVSKLTAGAIILTSTIIGAVTGAAVKSTVCAAIIKVCSVIGGPWTFVITVVVVALTLLVSWLVMVIDEAVNGKIDWEDNPMPDYLYDVKEVGFAQMSENEGIATEYVKRPVFCFYEAVRDEDGQVADLNARSYDASQWIGLYVSYDCAGDDSKPIKAEDLLVKTGNGETPDGYKPLTRFSEIIAYNLNQWDDEDEVNGIYMFYKQDEEAIPVAKNKTYYISDVYLQMGESPAHCIALLEKSGYTPLNVNLSPDHIVEGTFSSTATYTYLGYKTTTVASSAIRDLRVVYGPNQGEIMLGAANYAECGSNGWVTLYATKYESAGSPILEGGLMCVNSREEAPKGYEPVNFFAGGPAVSFNYIMKKDVRRDELKGVEFATEEYFIYFLPEQTFSEGKEYYGGIAFLNVDHVNMYTDFMTMIGVYGIGEPRDRLMGYLTGKTDTIYLSIDDVLMDYLLYKSGYNDAVDTNNFNTVAYYMTHNPYRAIYDIKGTNIGDTPANFAFEGVGYTMWNTMHLLSIDGWGVDYYGVYVDSNEMSTVDPLELTGKFYVSGNPSTGNVYDKATGEMKKVQPIEYGDLICATTENGIRDADVNKMSYTLVTDAFKDNSPVSVYNDEDTYFEYDDNYIQNAVRFYRINNDKDRPYVSNIVVVDELSLYRGAGGADAGIKREHITDAMLYKQLAAQGATNFCGFRVLMQHWNTDHIATPFEELNATRFGFTRTASKDDALTDLFIYINDFSFDDAPKTMNRGNIVYSLICEIPYNLTGYEDAPSYGVWLYGTTDKRAGGKILDFEVSDTPFVDGYEAVRTQNGRSPWAEIVDLTEKGESTHFLGWAEELYEDLKDFFRLRSGYSNSDPENEHSPYYFLIKREGDPITMQKPYIEELFLAEHTGYATYALDEFFDKGADGYLKNDLTPSGRTIYLGYRRTENPEKAITGIAAYHQKNPSSSMMSSKGHTYKLVKNLDLNVGAGGDYIYLYSTKDGEDPIISLDIGSSARSNLGQIVFEDGPDGATFWTYEWVTTRWNENVYSNLNAGTSGAKLYLFTKNAHKATESGTYKTPNYTKTSTEDRDGVADKWLDPNGKYIAELYVMDKETLNEELGYPICYTVSEQQIFDKLTEMGATEIITTPIYANSKDFGYWNDNKAYIGFSRTNEKSKAIKDIAIHVELISHIEPREIIEINRKAYHIVAESANDVVELPKAINLLELGDNKQVAFPKMYIYTSTSGTSPGITDLCIDRSPLLQGWNTVRSSNGIDPFVDVQNQAYEHYLLADKDDEDSYDEELVYTDSLFEWMDDLSQIFDPAEENVTTFYMHTKNYTESSVEETRPYIEEIYLAAGDSRHDALTQLVEFNPDGFIDIDLNLRAGGKHVYLAYKRTAKASAALRDLMIYEGSSPSNTRRVDVNGSRIRYDLVANVDLNAKAGGWYLYLYASDSSKVGNPITTVGVVEDDIPTRDIWCGVDTSPILLVERDDSSNVDRFTDICIDINRGARGAYLYMYMTRETNEGHWLIGRDKVVEHKDPTCGKDGYHYESETCFFCQQTVEFETILEKTNKHVDKDGDGDHKCDICKKRDVTSCIRGEPTEEDIVAPYIEKLFVGLGAQMTGTIEGGIPHDGSCTLVYRCTECGDVLLRVEDVVISATPENIAKYSGQDPASIFGSGSIVAICIFGALGVLAAIMIPIFKKKRENKGDE